jgi:hypothetical protein
LQAYEQHRFNGKNIFSEHQDVVHNALHRSYPHQLLLACCNLPLMLSTLLQEWMFTSCVENRAGKPLFHALECLKTAR